MTIRLRALLLIYSLFFDTLHVTISPKCMSIIATFRNIKFVSAECEERFFLKDDSIKVNLIYDMNFYLISSERYGSVSCEKICYRNMSLFWYYPLLMGMSTWSATLSLYTWYIFKNIYIYIFSIGNRAYIYVPISSMCVSVTFLHTSVYYRLNIFRFHSIYTYPNKCHSRLSVCVCTLRSSKTLHRMSWKFAYRMQQTILHLFHMAL